MSTGVMMEGMAEASPRFKARIAGVFYLLNILTGALTLFVGGRLGFAALLIATACYIAVTLGWLIDSLPRQTYSLRRSNLSAARSWIE